MALLAVVAGAADGMSQTSGQVRLSLLESDGGSARPSCTLELVAREASGDATLACERNTQPVSRLAARRDLTASESARFYMLASASPSWSQGPANGAPMTENGVQVVLTIERDNTRRVLDARPLASLSDADREIVRRLREISDELRAAVRR